MALLLKYYLVSPLDVLQCLVCVIMLLSVHVYRTLLRLHPLLIAAATVLDEEVDLVGQHDQTHHQRDHDAAVLEVDRAVGVGGPLQGSGAHHRAVVHSHEEGDELCQVADVGTIVVVGMGEGQVDQVVD